MTYSGRTTKGDKKSSVCYYKLVNGETLTGGDIENKRRVWVCNCSTTLCQFIEHVEQVHFPLNHTPPAPWNK